MPEQSPTRDETSATLLRMAEVLIAEDSIETVLGLVVDLAEKNLAVAHAVSVTLGEDGRRVTAASSGAMATELDDVQYAADEGPCIDAIKTGTETHSFPLDMQRWQRFSKTAQGYGVEGMYSLPLKAGEKAIGALNIYSLQSEPPDESDRWTARNFARQASVLLANTSAYADARRYGEQLMEAVHTRDVIGQAKGILMEREGLTPDQAFDALREKSQRSNVKLRDVAQQLVESAQKPK